MAKHQRQRDWEAVYQLCHDCLATTDESGQPNLLASDWAVWRLVIEAAAELKATKPEYVYPLMVDLGADSNQG